MTAPGIAAALRARVWRFVRDAGRVGMASNRVLEHFSEFDPRVVTQTLHGLKAHGFVRHMGRSKPYLVDEDCKVPAGETAELGPGWDEEFDPRLAQHVVRSPAAGAAPEQPVPVFTARATAPFVKVPRSVLPSTCADEPEQAFKAWLSSAGTLGLCLSGGVHFELSSDDTRQLFAWLDRIGNGMLQARVQEMQA